jgi:uncharacterized protein
MAGSSLLALLDDIATVLDDVAILSKVAAKKTAGVLGDDLALNAEQVSGVRANRELPVVWAVAKGSFINKLILVPAALLISVFAPWLIMPLLMMGGGYLCYEGFEKVYHVVTQKKADKEHKQRVMLEALTDPKVDLVKFEQKKIKGAIRTDFVLSAEIIVIVLGTVQEVDFATQAMVVSTMAIVMTVGVYGLVAAIVRLDDAGLYLIKSNVQNSWADFKRLVGRALLVFAPFLMKFLTVVGTLAMFLVGGSILLHGLPFLIEPLTQLKQAVSGLAYVGAILGFLVPLMVDLLAGLTAGALLLIIISSMAKFRTKS